MPDCNILVNAHPMLGMDIHQGTPAPITPPVPMPHFVAQLLGGFNTSKTKLAKSVLSHNFIVLNQGTDIGPGIGHVAANILFPLYVLTSASVSHFGSFSVLSENKPTAAAMLMMLNPNMNCASPLNMPTSQVIAIATNTVGMNISDYIAGGISATLDATISFAFGKIGGAAIKGLSSLTVKAVGFIPGRIFTSAIMVNVIRSSNKISSDLAGEILGGALGVGAGGFLGNVADTDAEFYREAIIPNYSNGTIIS